jgi:hypothetical protein
VGVRVADVDGDRVAVPGEQRRQTAVDLLEGVVPRSLHQFAPTPHERGAQAVGVVVQLLDPEGLGTEEALGEDVVLVAPHLHDIPPLHRDREPAGRFAEGAGAVMGAGPVLRGHRAGAYSG